MHVPKHLPFIVICLILTAALAVIWPLTSRSKDKAAQTSGAEVLAALPSETTSTGQLKLFLPADELSILDQSPLSGLDDLSTTLVNSTIELDLK